jgi:hypothetical protein
MNTNKPLGTSASGWTKTAALIPLLVCSLALYAQSLPNPTIPKAAAKAPAVKAPATAPAKPATQPTGTGGATTRPPAVPGRTTTGGTPAAERGPVKTPQRQPSTTPKSGTREVTLPAGGTARFDKKGNFVDLHKGHTDIHRAPNGVRTIRFERADHSSIFVGRGNHGWVQQPFRYGGHDFARRTYYKAPGAKYDRFYRSYVYRGVYLEGYAPVRYYPTGFYGFVYNPWAAPVPLTWGWAGIPVFVYYSPYFTPFAVYPSAALWLTDYLIAFSLVDSYGAQMDAGVPPPAFATSPAPITPDMKELISEEVQRQLALENAEAQQVANNVDPDPVSSGIARMLSDNASHVLVAGVDLDVMDNQGQECVLSPGDVLQLNAPQLADGPDASLVVLASKPQECVREDVVYVGLADLQDMQNHMRETIDQGLGELQANAGKGGLPAIPQSARGQATPAPFAAVAPPPDPNAASEIAQQVQAADQAEREVTGYAQTQVPVAPPPTPVRELVTIGLTVDQVEAKLGQPAQTMDGANNRKIYIYKNPQLKITFKDGKVVDVE